MKQATIDIRGETFVMHPLRVLFREKGKQLLIADVHLGKVTHFRQAGIPVPRAALHENFRRLEEALLLFKPDEVFFLGDLFHSKANREFTLFRKFLDDHSSVSFHLVEGNHDLYSREQLETLPLSVHESYHSGDFIFSHDMEEKDELYNICGHLHPGIVLRGKGLSSMRLPCFYFSGSRAILPSFGRFTGMEPVRQRKGDRVFVVTEEEVIPFSLP